MRPLHRIRDPERLRRSLTPAAFALAIALHPVTASAAIQLAWNACPGAAGAVSTINFDCDPQAESIYALHLTFTLDRTVPDVSSGDGIFDLIFKGPDTPPFWHLSVPEAMPGSCDVPTLQIATRRGPACPSTSNLLCGPTGLLCEALPWRYTWGATADFPPNRARLLWTFWRAQSPPVPVTLPPGPHYALAINFSMPLYDPDREYCEGCATEVGLSWNQLVLFNRAVSEIGSEDIAAVLSSSDPGSEPSVGINCAPGACLTVPARRTTWGQLKSLYR